MRVLVTGAAGFVGSYLVPSLTRDGHEVVGTAVEPAPGYRTLDVRNSGEVERLIAELRPDGVFHLAAQSSAALSWKEPALTYEVNVSGTHYLLDAIRRHSPKARVLIPCTSDQYGRVNPEQCPVTEDAPQRPVSPYASSKMAQEAVGRMFHEGFGLATVCTRAFMHIGPGQPPSFATGDWARQIALAEVGRADRVVRVGNLDLKREFGDVRDVVEAYRGAMEQGVPGEVYNVATGEARPLGDALHILLRRASVEMRVEVDPAKLRPADPPLLEGSARKLHRLTGWVPRHRLEDTLAEVLDHWRATVRSGSEAVRG
ncbi:MAG: GDP-mannose 4,6-dehydratase [Actinomycetota bacterium]|nr:GDP-mannose 4,6-dehydratase [Actinomycetota bacterium]